MMQDIPRRKFIINGGAALTAIALLHATRAYAYPSRAGEGTAMVERQCRFLLPFLLRERPITPQGKFATAAACPLAAIWRRPRYSRPSPRPNPEIIL